MKARRRIDGCLIFPDDLVRLNRQTEPANRKARLEDTLLTWLLVLLVALFFVAVWLNVTALP